MKTVQTVTGVLDEKDVRRICPHEHLILDMTHEAIEPETEEEKRLFYGGIGMEILGKLRRNPYIVKTNLVLDSVDDAVEEVKPLTAAGCNLLLDLSVIGLGRDVEKLKEISLKSGLNIVCGCGLFVHDSKLGKYADMSEDELTALMLGEIRNGVGDTGIKPGVIGEIGTSEKIYPSERRALIAAANVSNETGLPVFVHTYPWSRAGLEAVDLLISLGVPARRICICHLDVSFDEGAIYGALERGVYVEFDNLSKEFYFPSDDGAFAGGPFETDVARARMLKRLTEQGFADRLLLANDLCLKASLHKYGGDGYDYVFGHFAMMMKMEGVSPENVTRLLDENPRRFLFGD